MALWWTTKSSCIGKFPTRYVYHISRMVSLTAIFLFFDYTKYIFIVIAKAARGNSTMEFWSIGIYIL